MSKLTNIGPFNDLYDEIERSLKDAFPGVKIEAGWPDERQLVEFPAIYYDATETMQPIGEASGSIDLPVSIEFLIAVKNDDKRLAQISARNVATEIGAIFHETSFSWSSRPNMYLGSDDIKYDRHSSKSYEMWVTRIMAVLNISSPKTNFDQSYDDSLAEAIKEVVQR